MRRQFGCGSTPSGMDRGDCAVLFIQQKDRHTVGRANSNALTLEI
jgi:hypothetical protein